MHDGHVGLVVVNGVLDRLAHQTLGAFTGNRLDADTRGIRETDLGHAHLLHEELDQLLGLVRFRFVLDAGIDVFGIFTEDHHVGLLGLLQRRRHALEILHGTQANVEVEFLAQGDVERSNAATHRCRQRALDGNHILFQRRQRLFRQPDVGSVDLGRLFACVHLHPVDLLLAAVRLGNRGIHDLEHHRRDVETGAVTFNVRNNRLIGHIQRHVGIDSDLLAFGGHFDVLVHVESLRLGCVE